MTPERERLVAALEEAEEQYRNVPYWKNRDAIANARIALERFDKKRKEATK